MSESSAEYQRHPRDGVEALVDRLRNLEREVGELKNNLLKQASVGVKEDRLVIGQNLDVEGQLLVTGATRIEGDLEVPSGSIRNDFLENPIEVGADAGNANDFTLTPDEVDFATFTIPVPAGYSRALVKAEGMVFAYNDTDSRDYMYCRVYVDSPSQSTWSRRLLGALNSNDGASLTVTKQTVFEDLAGGVVTIRLALQSAFAPIFHESNAATATAAAWFLR